MVFGRVQLLNSADRLLQMRINIHTLVQDARNQTLILGKHLENDQMPTLPKLAHFLLS